MMLCLMLFLVGCVVFLSVFMNGRRDKHLSKQLFKDHSAIVIKNHEDNIYNFQKKNRDILVTLKLISLVVYNNEEWKRNLMFILVFCGISTIYLSGKINIFPGFFNYIIFFFLSLLFLSGLVIILFFMKKRERFDNDFIAFIDLFASHCNSGKSISHSLEQSIASLRNNILLNDLNKIVFLLGSGVSMQQCVMVTGTTKRYPYLYYNLFFTMLMVSIDKGGELTKNIIWLKDQMVKKKKIEDKIKTLTAEAKMSRNILVVLPVAFMAITYFFNKENFFWLINTHAGNIVLIISWGLIALGVIISSLIVSNATKV